MQNYFLKKINKLNFKKINKLKKKFNKLKKKLIN